MLLAENVSFTYPGQQEPILKELTLAIPEGKFTAILGHNGSGKSTLARLFNALLIPQSGTVSIDGISTSDPDKVWEIRKNVGMVFQNPDNQLVATTVMEDVAFGPENLALSPQEIRKRVEEALHKVGMWEYRNHAPHQLSGGQKQRVAVAGILAMRPKYIIFDEATAMLDPRGRDEVMDTILDLNKEGDVTPIIITHFMEEALLADRVIVMEKGKIAMEGSPKEILQLTDELRKLRLDIPPLVELKTFLAKKGINVTKDAISINEVVEDICRLK